MLFSLARPNTKSGSARPRTAKRPKLCPPFLADNGCSVAISFGEPLPSGFYKGMDRAAILTDMQARIAAAHADAERLRRKPRR